MTPGDDPLESPPLPPENLTDPIARRAWVRDVRCYLAHVPTRARAYSGELNRAIRHAHMVFTVLLELLDVAEAPEFEPPEPAPASADVYVLRQTGPNLFEQIDRGRR